MGSIEKALCWDGNSPMISLWVIVTSDTPLDLDFRVADISPKGLAVMEMESEDDPLTGGHVFEYDLRMETLPQPLLPYLQECLRRACAQAAQVAWLGFEGSFHFDHLLTKDIASQIYGLCAENEPPRVEVDHDVLRSPAWRESLRPYRERLR